LVRLLATALLLFLACTTVPFAVARPGGPPATFCPGADAAEVRAVLDAGEDLSSVETALGFTREKHGASTMRYRDRALYSVQPRIVWAEHFDPWLRGCKWLGTVEVGAIREIPAGALADAAAEAGANVAVFTHMSPYWSTGMRETADVYRCGSCR
jgi:hypothetical protein